MAVDVYPKKPVSRPHTQISVDTSGIGGSTSGSDKILMLIGSATGGAPNTVYRVRNYQEAKAVFRSGELLDAIELAWNPSADGSISAGDILAMRVEDATQAKLTKGGLTIQSSLYGLDANNIQVALEDNALTGTKRLKVSFVNDGINLVYDNLGKIFKIKYTGTETSATAVVTQDSITKKATKLTLKTTKDSTDTIVKDYTLGTGVYADVNSLISDINNLPGFTATFFPIGDKNISTADLDAVASLDIKVEDAYLTGLAGDIAKQTAYNGYVTFTVGTDAITNFGFTNLAGGTDGVAPESWAEKISLFANEGGYYLVPLTDKESVHAEALAFVRDRTDNGDPMRAIVGCGIAETVQQVISRATRLRNARVALVGFSGTRAMDDGRLVSLSGYMLASQIAGYACGLEIGEAVTFKPLALTSLDTILTSNQLDQLNENGVITGHVTDGIGFTENLRANGFDVEGKKTVVLGAGGAATAVQVQLAIEGAKEVRIFNLKDNFFERAEETKSKLANKCPECLVTVEDILDKVKLEEAINNCDIVINATTVGMKPNNDKTLLDKSLFRKDLVVADTVYDPEKTRMLIEAEEAGCKIIGGKGMLLCQGAANYEIFVGKKMPLDEFAKFQAENQR